MICMAENTVSMPGVFGGLMRYDEEYQSKFPINPAGIIVFVVLIVLFRIGLAMFYG